MDNRKQPTLNLIQHPAHLWVGATSDQIETQLHNCICRKHTEECTISNLIKQRQHAQLLWIKPEKMYTLADIEPLFEIMQFTLESDYHFFFILEKADYLSVSVANRLLKIIEEPPKGYHFIFLAQRQDQLLPTIKSRCIITHFSDNPIKEINHELARCFKSFPLIDSLSFNQILEKTEINEQQTFELIDQLFIYWQSNTLNNHQKNMLCLLCQALDEPPMPGSTKLFWKNLYLQAMQLPHLK